MKIVDRLNENWLMATEIHKLEARLWRKSQRDRIRVILFSSASRGEGKSTTVACLAAALGLYPDRRVLAIDLDFREPQLNSHFEVEVTTGLGAVLRRECRIEEAIIKSVLPSLDLVLPAAEGEDPALLLRTPELWQMFADFRKVYDLVLMDVPALIPVADASVLLPLADGVILLAMAGKTTKHELTTARELCLGMEANILGLVVGNLQEAIPDRGYGYGYGYGYYRGNGTLKSKATEETADGTADRR
jgi:capsular exopolysaccharide synthesis family protein